MECLFRPVQNSTWSNYPSSLTTYGYATTPPQNYNDNSYGYWNRFFHVKFEKVED